MADVIHLQFKTPKLEEDVMCFLSCVACKNKTFSVIEMDKDFPLLRCAACGAHIDRIGWVNDDEITEGE